jgi:hypothetical protein
LRKTGNEIVAAESHPCFQNGNEETVHGFFTKVGATPKLSSPIASFRLPDSLYLHASIDFVPVIAECITADFQ